MSEKSKLPILPILQVKELSVHFPNGVDAIKNISFSLYSGKTLALVGESGSGKSVTSNAIMRLLDYTPAEITHGDILYHIENKSINLLTANKTQIHHIRGSNIAMIYQEPMTSLDPVFTIGSQLREVLQLHKKMTLVETNREAIYWLKKVKLPDAESLLERYPHELSGGMRQRVMIAMALCCRPDILIADEPTTALDVTIQAQILQLIRELQEEMQMAVLFITHDMGVVAQMADDVLVMRHGERVEFAPVQQIFSHPVHEYTKALLAAVPRIGSMTNQSMPTYFEELSENPHQVERLSLKVPEMEKPILRLDNVTTRYTARKTWWGKATHQVFACEQISLTLFPGETLALVGESGSGKSTLGKLIQQLVPIQSGEMYYQERPFSKMTKAEKLSLQRDIQYIFQDHFAALDPRYHVATNISEPIKAHHLVEGKAAIERRVNELLEQVGLDESFSQRYAHELSGGQRARVCIARALASEPKVLIADESIAALDVSIQAQILNLLLSLQAKLGLACLFITHDMAVVERVSHRVAVMYLGQIVEYGSRQAIFEHPVHPYTKKLLSAVPIADPNRKVPPVSDMAEDMPSNVRDINHPPKVLKLTEINDMHLAAI